MARATRPRERRLPIVDEASPTGSSRGDYRSQLAGAHVSTSGGIHTAIDRAVERGCESIQIFTQSPRAWRPTNHPVENIMRFRERREEEGSARSSATRST